MEKGYKNVTMKDIVDACEISRGGLYLYFPGTRELFLEVLKAEQEDSGSEFEQKIGKDFGPADILALFLKEQKRELLTKKGTLQKACYEFFFEENDYSRENLLKKQYAGRSGKRPVWMWQAARAATSSLTREKIREREITIL